MKKILKISLTVFICIILCTNIALASQTSDLQSEQEKNNSEIRQNEQKQQEIKNELSSVAKQVEELSNKISSYEDEIDKLNDQISGLQKEIKQTEENLQKAQKDYEEKQELLDARLVAIYEAGEVSYLDVLLGSGSITELISNYYLVQQLAEFDTEVLNQIEQEKKEIEEAKTKLEQDKKSLDDAKAMQEQKAQELKSQKAEKDKKASELSESERKVQEEIDDLKQANRDIDKKIAQIMASQSSNSSNITSNPSASGYIRPVQGYPITTGLYYSSGAYHGAVDFSGSGISGKPVLAVKDGTVILTQRLTTSYGNYVMINHHDGTITLYAHGQEGSICVSEGQEVKQGQQIMRVGSTGNSTGPHLHFEVRLSPGYYSNRVNPIPYLP